MSEFESMADTHHNSHDLSRQLEDLPAIQHELIHLLERLLALYNLAMAS